jgi:hypothetical protein
MVDRRDQTIAGIYRRAAHEAEQCGLPATALLFRNAAWLEEMGMDWLMVMRQEPQDSTVKGPDDV